MINAALLQGQALLAAKAAQAGGYSSNIPGSPFFGGRAFGSIGGNASGPSIGGTSFAAGLTAGAAANAIQGFSAAASQGQGALGGLYETVKNASGPFGKLAFTVAELPSRIADWGRALVDSQRHLSIYSGTMASAAMQLDAQRIGRDINKAQRTGDSFAELTKSQNRMEKAMQDYNVAFQNASNNVQAWIQNALADFAEGFKSLPVVSAALEYFANAKSKADSETILNQVFSELSGNLRRDIKKPIDPIRP